MADEITNQQDAAPAPEAPAQETPAQGAPVGGPAASEPVQAAREAGPTHAPHSAPPSQYGRGGGRGGRGGRGGGGGRGDRGGRRRDAQPEEEDTGGFEEAVVKIYRCATVVKGGRRFSFSALVVVGDRSGQVGMGYGKANEVPSAVEKATKAARRNVIKVKLAGSTIPHRTMAKFGASKVLLLPASEGTGVIAGASVRAVMELAGIRNVLTKAYGSTSPKNLVKAAFLGLQGLRSKEDVAKARAVSIA